MPGWPGPYAKPPQSNGASPARSCAALPEPKVNSAAVRAPKTGNRRPMRPVRHVQDPTLPDHSGIALRVRRERAEQGLPEKVEDPVMLAKIVTLAFEGLATPSR